MDENKWRIKKVYGLWYTFAPGEDTIPDGMENTFEESVYLLPSYQMYRFIESKRWRDG